MTFQFKSRTALATKWKEMNTAFDLYILIVSLRTVHLKELRQYREKVKCLLVNQQPLETGGKHVGCIKRFMMKYNNKRLEI